MSVVDTITPTPAAEAPLPEVIPQPEISQVERNLGTVSLGTVMHYAAHGWGNAETARTRSEVTRSIATVPEGRPSPVVNGRGYQVRNIEHLSVAGETTLANGTKAISGAGRLERTSDYYDTALRYVISTTDLPSGKRIETRVVENNDQGRESRFRHDKFIVDPVTGERTYKSRMLKTPREQDAAKRFIAKKFDLEFTPKIEEKAAAGAHSYKRLLGEDEVGMQDMVEKEIKRIVGNGITEPKKIKRELARAFHHDNPQHKSIPEGVDAGQLMRVVNALNILDPDSHIVGIDAGGKPVRRDGVEPSVVHVEPSPNIKRYVVA